MYDKVNLYKIIRLNEICHKITDGTHKTPKYTTAGIPFLSVKDIKTGHIDFNNLKYISKDEHLELIKRCKPEKDDILYTKIGTIGKACIIDTDVEFSIFVSICLLKLKIEQVFPHYLKWALNSDYVKRQALRRVKGIGVPDLHLVEIKDFKIPLPPLPVQRKIASILEKAESAKEKRKVVNRLTDEFLKSVFLEMFGDPVRNSKNYRTNKIEELCLIKSGGTPSRKNTDYFKGDIPWITSVALNSIYIDKKHAVELISKNAVEESATTIIPSNSILLGSRVGVGKTSINLCQICTSQDILALISKTRKDYIPEYFLFVLKSFSNFLIQNQRGATIKGITINLVKKIEIPLPPIELQQKFADIVQKVEKLKEKQKESEKELDNLFSSLMQKTFSGEIK